MFGRTKKTKTKSSRAVSQLQVDVYQTSTALYVYGLLYGMELSDVSVAIEEDGHVVVIEGERRRPEYALFPESRPAGTFVGAECVWGKVYRRIILPVPVVVEQVEARLKNGVLLLTLPLQKNVGNKTDVQVKGA